MQNLAVIVISSLVIMLSTSDIESVTISASKCKDSCLSYSGVGNSCKSNCAGDNSICRQVAGNAYEVFLCSRCHHHCAVCCDKYKDIKDTMFKDLVWKGLNHYSPDSLKSDEGKADNGYGRLSNRDFLDF